MHEDTYLNFSSILYELQKRDKAFWGYTGEAWVCVMSAVNNCPGELSIEMTGSQLAALIHGDFAKIIKPENFQIIGMYNQAS